MLSTVIIFFTKYTYFKNCFCDLTVVGARIMMN
jgi:hypothetical protein